MIKGPDIRDKRKSLGLTVIQLADLLGVDKANLYKWEKGHLPSNPVDYNKLEKWLNEIESVPRITNQKEDKKLIDSEAQQTILERLLEEKEARRIELSESLKLERDRVDRLLKVIEDNLNILLSNSDKTLYEIQTVLRHDRASDQVAHDDLDELRGKPVGTSSTRADKLELAAKARLQKKDKKNQDGGGKSHTRA